MKEFGTCLQTSSWQPSRFIADLGYVGDTAIKSDNLQKSVLSLPYLESNALKVGLIIYSADPVYDKKEHPSIMLLKITKQYCFKRGK